MMKKSAGIFLMIFLVGGALYYFTLSPKVQTREEYEDFIKQMTDKGFEDSDPIKQNKFGGQFVQRLYTKGNITVSLGTFKERREFKCYVLTYFQKQKK